MRNGLFSIVSVALLITTGCSDASSNLLANPGSQSLRAYLVPSTLTLSAHADRQNNGGIVISGKTNLPDGLKMWVEIEEGKLPLGAPRVIASDENVFVKNGTFQTNALWHEVPNTTFTKKGWPKRVTVNVRERPFSQTSIKVHFEVYFNGAWQNSDVLLALGNNDGKNLEGTILKRTDPDVSDSAKVVDYHQLLVLPVLSSEAKAIDLVKMSVLAVPGEGRSAGDVQANIDLSTSPSGVSLGKGWSAKALDTSNYEVSYDFANGARGEEQALWRVKIAVKYVNENAKIFSWSPNY